MKTPLIIISLIFLLSCSEESADPQILLRSDYISYNPGVGCAGQTVTVTYDNGYGNNCGKSRIQQYIGASWVTVIEECPVNGIVSYSFIPATSGEYRFRASWTKSGRACNQGNIKPFEEDPLVVERECCRDYFTATAICRTGHACPYGLEFHLSLTMDNWISITGTLPPGYQFCGFYDEFGNIVEAFTGNVIEIVGDVYACYDIKFFVYFTSPDPDPSFGKWTVMDMNGTLYILHPPPCD